MTYKLGSLFDGSGGFPLSGALCGIAPVWAAEVEPYPIAVTRSRFPNMKHLGDISKVSGADIEPVVFDKEVYQSGVCVHYIVRRLTPTECARLQGFADWHGHLEKKESLTEEEYKFWLEVRNTHAAINGKAVKAYTTAQMLTWYNKLWTDAAEYKMWGNGIALPPALYCMQGIVDALNREEDDAWML